MVVMVVMVVMVMLMDFCDVCGVWIFGFGDDDVPATSDNKR